MRRRLVWGPPCRRIARLTRASTWQVREAQLAQYNFILVVGSSEEEADSVNVRTRDNEVHGSKTVSDFVAELKDRVAKHE